MIEPRSRGVLDPRLRGDDSGVGVAISPSLRAKHCARNDVERGHQAATPRAAATFVLDHGCRSAILVEGLRPTACRGMVDGMFEGFTTFLDRAACLTR
jgi:hypothetical protein